MQTYRIKVAEGIGIEYCDLDTQEEIDRLYAFAVEAAKRQGKKLL